MTMRRPRVLTPRRDRMFITTEVALTLVAADISTNSQQITNQISSDFETRTGRTLRGATVGRTWVTGDSKGST